MTVEARLNRPKVQVAVEKLPREEAERLYVQELLEQGAVFVPGDPSTLRPPALVLFGPDQFTVSDEDEGVQATATKYIVVQAATHPYYRNKKYKKDLSDAPEALWAAVINPSKKPKPSFEQVLKGLSGQIDIKPVVVTPPPAPRTELSDRYLDAPGQEYPKGRRVAPKPPAQ